jgi:WD40 repeat protein
LKKNTVSIFITLFILSLSCSVLPQNKTRHLSPTSTLIYHEPTQIVTEVATTQQSDLRKAVLEQATLVSATSIATVTVQPTMTPVPSPVPVNAGILDKLIELSPGNAKYLSPSATLWPANFIVSGMAFYPGKNMLLLGTGQGYSYSPYTKLDGLPMTEGTKIILWDLITNLQQDVIEIETKVDSMDINSFQSYKSVAVSPDGEWVVLAGSDRMLLGSIVKDTANSGPQFSHQEILYNEFANPNPDGGAAFSPDSRLLAISNGYGDIQVWDVQTKQTLATFLNGKRDDLQICFGGQNSGITFTPDGTMLLEICGFNIVTWDLRSGIRSEAPNLLQNVNVFALSPNGDFVVTGDEAGTLKVWRYPSWEAEVQLNGQHQAITSLAFNPDGSLLASSSLEGTVQLWDTSTWIGLITVQAVADFMAFSQDNRSLVMGTYVEGGNVWGVRSDSTMAEQKKETTSILLPVNANIRGSFDGLTAQNGSWVEQIAELWPTTLEVRNFVFSGFSSQGTSELENSFYLAYSTYDGMKFVLWNPQTNTGWDPFGGVDPAILIDKVAVSPDGQWLVLTGNDRVILGSLSNSGSDSKPTFTIQNIPVDEFKTETPGLNTFFPAFSHDSNLLAIENNYGDILIWDLNANNTLALIRRSTQSDFPECVRNSEGIYFTSDDTVVISACRAKILSLDLTTLKSTTVINIQGDGGIFTLSPNGKFLAQASYDELSITIWGFPSGGPLARLKGHELPITNLVFNLDGSLLASSSQDGTVNLWETQTGKRLSSRMLKAYFLAFSPDSQFLVTGSYSDDGGLLWGVKPGSSTSTRSGLRVISIMDDLDLYPWLNAIPSNWIASEEDFPRFEIRFTPAWKEIEDCPYIPQKHLIRRQVGVIVKVTDLDTGSVLATNTFWGELPDLCPTTYSFLTTASRAYQDGLDPDQSSFITWLTGLLAPYGYK